MIDTHAHIFLEHFAEDIDQTIRLASESGVHKILLPNIDSSTTQAMLDLSKRYDHIYPMIGLHPCSVKADYEKELAHASQELEKGEYIAVGEIGTDLYWDKTFWVEQQDAFNQQCELALSYQLPIVIHCRETIDETIDLVKPWAQKGLNGVFHCFTGSEKQAHAITDLNFYLGVGGVATFKNGGMDKVLPFVSREMVVLETDSPYLAPAPNRGKRNEPAFLKLIANKLAEYWGADFEEVDYITSQNAKTLFDIA